jgi:hypothetical protein
VPPSAPAVSLCNISKNTDINCAAAPECAVHICRVFFKCHCECQNLKYRSGLIGICQRSVAPLSELCHTKSFLKFFLLFKVAYSFKLSFADLQKVVRVKIRILCNSKNLSRFRVHGYTHRTALYIIINNRLR